MKINTESNGSALTLVVEGRLDTTTAPELEQKLHESLNNIDSLIFDFSSLEYISSAGLRILLGAQKKMAKQGNMVVRGCNEEVMEVFDITGFSDILTLE